MPEQEELTPEEARNKLRAILGQQISTIDANLAAVRAIKNPDPVIINLHNASLETLKLCTIIIGAVIFPEDTVAQQEAANESPIITES